MFDLPDEIYYKDSEFPQNLPGISDSMYETILKGLKNGQILVISYLNAEEIASERRILAEVLLEYNQKWYIGAYCYLREEERSFRIDRIQEIKLTSEHDGSHGIAELYRSFKEEVDEVCSILGSDEKWEQKQLDIELCHHAERGEIEKMRQDIAAGANINAQFSDNLPPLHSAAREGQLEAVKFLLAYGADPELKNPRKENALFTAVRFRRMEIMRFLVEECHCSLNDQNIFGWTMLYVSLDNIDLQSAQYLLDNGADINLCDKKGESMLMKAVHVFSSNTESPFLLTDLLLKYGADIRAVDKKGQNILFHAALDCHPELLEHLLSKAPDLIRSKDRKGRTILFAALEHFCEIWRYREPAVRQAVQRKIISILCARGADVNARNSDGKTPLMIAPEWLFDVLFEHGADPCSVDNHGTTVAICRAKNPQHVDKLFFAGADIMARDDSGTDVLMAAQPKQEHIRHYIDFYDFSVNDRNQKETILHKAVNALEEDTVLYLLENGADAAAVNCHGNTPLQELLIHHPDAAWDSQTPDGKIYDLLDAFLQKGFFEFHRACLDLDIEKLRSFPEQLFKDLFNLSSSNSLLNPVNIILETARENFSDPVSLLEEILDLFWNNSEKWDEFLLIVLTLDLNKSILREKYIRLWLEQEELPQEKINALCEEFLTGGNSSLVINHIVRQANDSDVL